MNRPANQPSPQRPPRARAHLYVVVLMTAVLVMVVGLSGLTLARVQFRTVNNETDLLRADAYARAALELGLRRIAAAADWRTRFVTSSWRRPVGFGQGALLWRLVDEEDGNAATNPAGPFRLYGKGACGEAVRNYSVLVEAPTFANLIADADFSEGILDWDGRDCQIALASGLQVTQRESGTAGPARSLLGQIRNGRRYALTLRLVADGNPREYAAAFEFTTGKGSSEVAVRGELPANQEYLMLSLTAAWIGAIEELDLRISAPDDNNDFRVQSLEIRPDPEGPLQILPETLRREADEALYVLDPAETDPGGGEIDPDEAPPGLLPGLIGVLDGLL